MKPVVRQLVLETTFGKVGKTVWPCTLKIIEGTSTEKWQDNEKVRILMGLISYYTSK